MYWELTNSSFPLLSQILPTLTAETVPAPCPVDDPPFIVVDPAYRHSVAQALFYKVNRTREDREREEKKEKQKDRETRQKSEGKATEVEYHNSQSISPIHPYPPP